MPLYYLSIRFDLTTFLIVKYVSTYAETDWERLRESDRRLFRFNQYSQISKHWPDQNSRQSAKMFEFACVSELLDIKYFRIFQTIRKHSTYTKSDSSVISMAILYFSRRKTLQMQRNESRAQMRPGKTPRSPSTSSSILSGSILGEENLSNEAEAETEDGSVFSKGSFLFRKCDSFFKPPMLQEKYFKLLSWVWNLNLLFTVIGGKFEFHVQDGDLEHFLWEIWKGAVY